MAVVAVGKKKSTLLQRRLNVFKDDPDREKGFQVQEFPQFNIATTSQLLQHRKMLVKEVLFVLVAITAQSTVTANPTLSQDLHVQSDVLHLNVNEPPQLGLFNAYAYMRCATEGFYGNPGNCSHFYRCVDLTGNATQYQKFDFICPGNAVFDENLNVCNHPAAVQPCTGSIGGLVGAINDEPANMERPSYPGTLLDEIGPPAPPTVAPSVANVRCKKSGVFRSEEDCRKFYICVDVFGDGTFFQLCEYPCPNGLIFSEDVGHCVQQSEGELCIGVQPPVSSAATPQTTPTVPPTTTGHHLYPETEPTTKAPPTHRPTTTAPVVSLPPIVPGPPCTSEGVFRHPLDCTKFYQCVDVSGNSTKKRYNRFDFQCGPGTVFDEALAVCNHPHAVPGCGAVSPTGYPVPSEIPHPQTFPPVTTHSTTPPPITVPSTVTPSQTIKPVTHHPVTSYPVTPGPVILLPPVTTGQPCVSEGYFRYPNDCSKFYRCVDISGNGTTIKRFTRYDFQCGNGTVFDESLSICNHPANVPSCVGFSVPPETFWTERPQITYPTHRPQPPTGIQTCHMEGFFRDPSDCTRFYQCVDVSANGTQHKRYHRYDFKCGYGTVFDEALEICNHPHAVPGCGHVTFPPKPHPHPSTPHPIPSKPETTPTSVVFPTHPPVTISFIPGSIPFQPEKPIRVCSKPGYYRYPYDCRKFYHCAPLSSTPIGGYFERHDYQCLHGNLFDDIKLVCAHPSLVSGCGSTQSNFTPPPIPPTHVTHKPGPVPLPPHPSWPYCHTEGYFTFPNDCTRFYQCVDISGNGTTVKKFQRHDFKCGPGTVFDESHGVCNHPHAVPGCGGTVVIIPTHTTHSPYPHVTRPPVTHTVRPTYPTSGTTRPSTPSPTTKPTPIPIPYPTPGPVIPLPPVIGGTPCSTEGYFRYPDDCSKFYRCVDISGNGTFSKQYIRYDFQCGNGTVFDVSISVCNHPEHVPGCGGVTSPRPTSVVYPSTTPWAVRPTGSPVPPVIPGPPCSREGVFRDPYDCTKFYQCVDNSGNSTTQKRFNRYDFKCGPGTVFDESLSVCNHPHAVPGCGGSIATSPPITPIATATYPTPPTPEIHPPRPTQTFGTTSHATYPTATAPTRPTYPEVTHNTPRPKPPIPSVPCIQEGFFPYPGNCVKFYYCLDVTGNRTVKQFVKYDYECGPGTVFDQSLNVCNHPLFVPGCEHFVGEHPTPTHGHVTSTIPTIVTEETLATSTQSSVITIGDNFCKREGFFRDPLDCSRFFRCAFVRVNGTTKRLQKYEFHCAFGFVFDEREVICTNPDKVPECVDYLPPLTTPCPVAHGTTDYPPHVTDTTTHSHVSTDITVTSEPSSTPTSTISAPIYTVPQTIKPVHSTTTDIEPAITTVSSNPTEGSGHTHVPIQVSTVAPTGPPCTREGLWRDPTDCTRFYRCVAITDDGRVFKRFEFKCPHLTVFDEVNGVCNFPHATSPCTFVQGPGYPTISPPVHHSTHSPSTTTTTIHGSETLTHVCTEAGSFKDPNDCTKYYLCTDLTGNGTHFHMCEVPCPENSYFDESSQRCSKHVGRYSCKFDISTVLDFHQPSSSDIVEQFDHTFDNETQNNDKIGEDYFNQLMAQLNEFRNESALFL